MFWGLCIMDESWTFSSNRRVFEWRCICADSSRKCASGQGCFKCPVCLYHRRRLSCPRYFGCFKDKKKTLRACLRLPFYSPDLNIIENLWSILKTRVAKRSPRSIDEFIVISQAEWTNISINDVRQYFYNIPNRIKAIINNNGKYSKY